MQQLFCEQYILDLNASKAAERAGFSAKSAEVQGYQLLQKPLVKDAISKLLEARAKKTGITAERVLKEIEALAFFDPKDLVLIKTPQDIADLPEFVRRAITGWSWDKDGRFTVKLNKEKALELLGRHLKLFTERIEHSGTITLEALVAGSNRADVTLPGGE